jgi:hypothetical protein
MSVDAELELKSKAAQLCREHAAKINLLMDAAVEAGVKSSTISQDEYWAPFLDQLSMIATESTRNANKMTEFRAVKKSIALALVQAPKIPVPVASKAEVPTYPVALQPPQKQSWWKREVVKPVQTAIKLLGFTKGT